MEMKCFVYVVELGLILISWVTHFVMTLQAGN